VIENENPNPLDNRADRAHANLAAAWREQDKAMLDALSNADGRQQRASIDVSFPKIQSGGIRAVRQNQRIIQCDVCDHPPTCNVHSRSVQAATSA
jgi:hypothetical protein